MLIEKRAFLIFINSTQYERKLPPLCLSAFVFNNPNENLGWEKTEPHSYKHQDTKTQRKDFSEKIENDKYAIEASEIGKYEGKLFPP
jgi:hypothetical protein